MSATPQCPHCGSFNRYSASYCSDCGGPLGTGGRDQVLVGPNPWSAAGSPKPLYGFTAFTRALRRQNDIDKTRTGLLLLIVGTFLSPLLYLNILGEIIIIVGALLVVLGRRPFGDVHSRNTILSAIIYIVGGSAISLGSIGVLLAEYSASFAYNTSGSFNQALFSQALGNAFQAFLIVTAVGGAIIGLAQVFFTYSLQIQNGKIFLWLGFFSSMTIGVLEVAMVPSLISNAVSQASITGLYDPTAFATLQSQLQTQLLLIGLLGLIPAAFYANAFYDARKRIEKGEIPGLRPSQYSQIGSFFDDSRYFLGLFAKVMLPIMILGFFGLVMAMLHHY